MHWKDITMEFFEGIFIEEYIVRGITKTLAKFNISAYSFNKFITKTPEAGAILQNAKAMRADMYVDDMVNIADTDPDPQRARNRIAARQFVASKFKPTEYGENFQVRVETLSMREVMDEANKRAFIKVPLAITAPKTDEKAV